MTDSINQWFAGTAGGEGATSPDASTWTIQSSFATAFGANQVNNAYHNRSVLSPLWVVVGAAGNMATSVDGVTWAAAAPGFSTSAINAVAYDPTLGVWVAGGANKKAFYTTNPNGTWTACTLPGGWSSSTIITGVASDLAGHLMIFGHDGATSVAAQSSDGHTFSSVTLSTLTGTITCAIHDHVGTWVLATSASEVAISTNRTSWTNKTSLSGAPHGPSSLASDEFPGGPTYLFGSSAQHVYATTDFTTYNDWEASPGSGPTSGMCAAADGLGLYAVGGVPIGTAELEYQNVGSSLGTAVVIGFSTGITALNHSNFGNIVIVNIGGNAAITLSSELEGANALAVGGVGSATASYLVDIIQNIAVSANGDISVTAKMISVLLVSANGSTQVTNKGSFVNAVVASAFGQNVVIVIFMNLVSVTAAATTTVQAVFEAVETIIQRGFGASIATSRLAALNSIIVVGHGTAGAVFGFYQPINVSAVGTAAQTNVLEGLEYVTTSAVVTAIVAHHLTVPILIAEALEAADAWSVHQDLKNFINAGGVVAMQISLGADDFTAWAMNTKTLGATQYTNFEFNSLADLDEIYCAKDDGVYKLGGPNDAGTDIVWELRTGLLNLGTDAEKRIFAAYFLMRSDAEPGTPALVLKTVTIDRNGEKIENWYEVEARAADATRATRVKPGKGLKSPLWQFALTPINGASIQLSKFQVLPVVLERRVG